MFATMSLTRRRVLHLAAGAAALPAMSRVARAQTYPTGPVRIIVPTPPGGVNDMLARLMGQWLSERLGRPFVIDNRPGAGNNIGTEAVVRAPADGYTLLLGSVTNAINASIYDKLKFDFVRDIAPVAGIMRGYTMVVSNPSVPAKTIPEFIAYAKANPGELNFASGGMGHATHVFGELFKMMTGLDLVHVPYRGNAPALTDLLGGQIQVMFFNAPNLQDYIRTGKLRVLAVSSATRVETLPDVPTVAEFVPGYEATGWWGIGTPRNTPAEIVDQLNKELNSGLANPKIRAQLASQDGTPFPGSPADFGKLMVDETEKWGRVVKFAGIQPV